MRSMGPPDGAPVILLHGFPYDARTFDEVAPALAADGCRVLVPYLRGYGPTRFLLSTTPRSGEQAALGHDLLQFMRATGISRAALAGYDWGGRAACVVAALWPEWVRCLVSCTGYNIQNIAASARADRGRAGAPLLVPVLFPHRARPRRPRPRTGATSAGCCGSCGRPNGSSTRRPSSGAPSRSTIPISSTS